MKTAYATLALIVFILSPAFAQLPPGALIHLQGDAGIVDSVGKVKEWRDATNPSIKFSAPLEANRPTHSASINNHRVVSFNGTANYLEGPNIFPTFKDYTVCMVLRIANFALSNNVVSGDTRAIFFTAATPRLLHPNFNYLATSTIPLPAKPSILIARYNQANQFGSFYVNGSSGDSGFVGMNTDTSIYLGAFLRSNFLGGDIAEVLIYPRYISDTERVHLEDSLFKKYAIPGPQPPDLTFTECPEQLQLYPRESDDSATVKIKALLKAKGFDSVYLKVLKNKTPYANYSEALHYNTEGAFFSFAPRIHAELSEYSFIIGVKSSLKDSVMRRRDSILCGDVILVCGQSNSIAGGDTYTNEFCRTYGYNYSQFKSDTLWSLSSAATHGGGSNVGSFPIRIQKNIAEKLGVPTVVINGGVGGTAIESHLPNDLNAMDLQTIYGSMLYRVNKSGLVGKAKTLFWYQGESNSITNYFDNFKRLYHAWHLDYPALEKIYVIQPRPGCNTGNASEMRELLRTLSSYYPDIVTHSTMALPGHDGCHFLLDLNIGYHILGDHLFALLGRDYDSTADTIGVNSPDITKAFFTSDDHRTIGLVFNTGGSGLVIPKDTLMYGLQTSIRDYFYVGSDTGIVTGIKVKGDTLFLQLSRASNARNISYLPDMNYNRTDIIYEGPWITNSKGLGAFSFWNVPITYHLDVLEPSEITSEQNAFVIFPNPASSSVKCKVHLNKRSLVRIMIFDELGRELLKAIDGEEDAGSYVLNLDTSSFTSSSVIVRIEIGKETYQSRLVLIH